MQTRAEVKVRKEKEVQELGRREEIGVEVGREETGVRRGGEDTIIDGVAVQAVVEAVAAVAAVAGTQGEVAADTEGSRMARRKIITPEKTVQG